jgi:hypothetical protein
MKGNSRLTSFTRSPAFQNSNYAKHTSYALLSSPWRPRYLSENAEAGQRQREGVISGSPGLQWGRTQREGMRLQCGTFSLPLAWQMLAFCIVLFCFVLRPGLTIAVLAGWETGCVGQNGLTLTGIHPFLPPKSWN